MCKVVVLDDNAAMRSVLSDIVSFMGHEVSAFAKIDPFLETVRRETPDCLIVDAMLLEDRNGLDIINQVQHMAGMESSRYILLTASTELNPLRERLKQHQIELLTKPCSLEDLEMALI